MDHFFERLPGWFDFADLYREQVQRVPSGAHFVEVGTYAGKSAACMAVDILNSGKQIRFDACDTFQGVDRANINDDRLYLEQEAHRGEDGTLIDWTRQNLAPVADAVNLRQGDSLALAATYADASLDFVFLDDDHSTRHLLKELVAWYPKVKPGGVLAGHDVNWPSVVAALEPWSAMRGLDVSRVSRSCWMVEKPVASVVDRLTTPVGQRKCLVSVCSNERTIYRNTAKSLIQLGWGARVPSAAEAHGFELDIEFAWTDRFTHVSDLRNEAVRVAQQRGCSHILFLDADMTWPGDVIQRMLAHHDKGIVSGLYFLKSWPHWPVALVNPRVNPVTLGVDYDYHQTIHEQTALVPVDLVGMGCALVPLVVCEAIGDGHWFAYRTDAHGNETVTEDVAFCQKAQRAGSPIWVDPTVACGHVAQQEITSLTYRRALHDMMLLDQQRMAQMAELVEQGKSVPDIASALKMSLVDVDKLLNRLRAVAESQMAVPA